MDPLTVQLLLLLVFGLLQLFFGYTLFRLLIVLAGAALGFAYGPALLANLTGFQPVPWVAVVAALLVALVLGLLAWYAFWALVFIWGFSFGYGLMEASGQGPVVAAVVGVIAGVLAAIFQRILIVALMAISGAGLTVYAVLVFLGALPPAGVDPLSSTPWLGLPILLLAVVGALVQFRRAEPESRF